MTVAATPPTPVDYPALFRTYVQRTVSHVLALLRREEAPPTGEQRTQALHALSYALKLPDAWPTARELLFELAPQMEQAGHHEDWVSFLKRGIERSQHFGDDEAEAELRFHLGVIHQRQAEFAGADDELTASAAQFEQMGDHLRQARALNRLAFVARLERRFDEASSLVERAVQLADGDQEQAAYAHLVRGAIAIDHQAWDDARGSFDHSRRLWESMGNVRMVAWSRTNTGIALSKLARYDEAIEAYEIAIDLLSTIQDALFLATTYNNLGNIYLITERYERAAYYYHLAEPIFYRFRDHSRVASVVTNQARTLQKRGLLEEAAELYIHNIEQWRAVGDLKWLVNAMDNLGETHLAQRNYDAACEVLEEALAALDRMRDDPEYESLRESLTEHLEVAKKGGSST